MKKCDICMRKVENSRIDKYEYKDKLVHACPECIEIEEVHKKQKHLTWIEKVHGKGITDDDVIKVLGDLKFLFKGTPEKSDLALKFDESLNNFIEDNNLGLYNKLFS